MATTTSVGDGEVKGQFVFYENRTRYSSAAREEGNL